VAGVLLTVSDSVPKDETHWSYWARVDTKLDGLHSAPAFYVPYPCESTAVNRPGHVTVRTWLLTIESEGHRSRSG